MFSWDLLQVIDKIIKFESPVDSEEGDSISRDIRQLIDKIFGYESPVDT